VFWTKDTEQIKISRKVGLFCHLVPGRVEKAEKDSFYKGAPRKATVKTFLGTWMNVEWCHLAGPPLRPVEGAVLCGLGQKLSWPYSREYRIKPLDQRGPPIFRLKGVYSVLGSWFAPLNRHLGDCSKPLGAKVARGNRQKKMSTEEPISGRLGLAAETPRCGALRHHHHGPINIISNGSAG
jgi:hypothetical protein